MALPDGSMVLICPTGPEYSQVEQAQFDSWSADPFVHVEEIDKVEFSVWFSNVKRVTTVFTVNTTDDGEITRVESNGIQWRVDPGTLLPLEANTGGHPFPRMHFPGAGGEGYETIYNTTNEFRYVNEEYPTDPYNAGLPDFFIHRDRFYFVYGLEYPSDDPDIAISFDFSDSSFTVTYIDTSSSNVITTTYTITIDQLFYP